MSAPDTGHWVEGETYLAMKRRAEEVETRIKELEAERDEAHSVVERLVREKARAWDADVDRAIEQELRGKLNARITTLSAAIFEAKEALGTARTQFAFYGEAHRAKKTPDGDAKAEVNETLAHEMSVVLAAIEKALGNG